MSSQTTTALLAHLFRRAGFGATPSDLATAAGYGGAVDGLLAGLAGPDPGAGAVPVPTFTAPPSDPAALRTDPAAQRELNLTLEKERTELIGWWIARMLSTTAPLREKLTLLLHCQFPTAISKVRFALYMHSQNQIFRTQGPGDFSALTQAVSTDPAMLIWLDAASDKAASPNENFARELMERFTMGFGTYGEADVRAAAACFTGWRFNRKTGSFEVASRLHSTTPQTFLQHSGVTTGQQVIDIVTRTTTSAHYVPARLWSHLAYPVTTDDPVVADLAAVYAPGRNMTALLRAIFLHPAFVSSAATTGLVKQPVEYVVGALRAFGVTPGDLGSKKLSVIETLAQLGQIPFDPPSVGGWPQNAYWLSTAAALARWRFAVELAASADISPVADQPVRARVEAVASQLSVSSWSAPTARSLADAAGNPRALVALALVSPEYVTN